MTEMELLASNTPEDKIRTPETRISLLAFAREKLNFSLLTNVTHVIRATANKDRMDSSLAQLNVDEALIIMNWKMKVLMTVYRESMVSPGWGLCSFAARQSLKQVKRTQRGVTNKKKRTGERVEKDDDTMTDERSFIRQFAVKFYDGLCDDGKEDSWASASHLQGASTHYKETHAPHVTKGHIMTDGTGCFS